MKKLFPILMVLVLGLAACSNGNGSQYAGKYVGTFKFIKDSTTKQGSVRITNNPLSQDGVLLYAVLPLNNIKDWKPDFTEGDYSKPTSGGLFHLGKNHYSICNKTARYAIIGA